MNVGSEREKSQLIDLSLAKGIRNATARTHQKFLDGITSVPEENVQNSWTKAKIFFISHYRKVLGNDHVLVVKSTSSTLELFFVIDGIDTGGMAYRALIKKRGHGSKRDDERRRELYVPIVFTNHFHQRLIQTPLERKSPIAAVLYALSVALTGYFFIASTGYADLYPKWSKVGQFAFVHREFLVLGSIDQDEDCVCRTLILKDRLEAPKLRLWRQANESPEKLFIHQSGWNVSPSHDIL